MLDGIGEACGVVGVWAPRTRVAHAVYRGLIALQHRGQESAGIAVADGERITLTVGMGEVRTAFDRTALAGLRGHLGIGHVRYSTTGDSTLDNAQPLRGGVRQGEPFALAHNGNLTRLGGAAAEPAGGVADTRALVALLAAETGPVDAALRRVLAGVSGAYSIVVCDARRLYAARDPHGFRPLCLGELPEGGWVVASESPALDMLGAAFVRDVSPGEVLLIDADGPRSTRFAAPAPAACSFEHVYFARSDSIVDGRRVQQVRRALGRALAREAPADGDVVVPVPDTARPAALGYAEQSGIRYDEGLARNNYVGRTFIQPEQQSRRAAVLLKLNPIADVVAGRRVVLVDDSIVRATSVTEVVAMLRGAGARRVHVRVASPPVRWPCFFGVDMKTSGELVANRFTPAEIGRLVGADSLGYLSVEALSEAVGPGRSCVGCFTGDYPAPVGTRLRSGSVTLLTTGDGAEART